MMIDLTFYSQSSIKPQIFQNRILQTFFKMDQYCRLEKYNQYSKNVQLQHLQDFKYILSNQHNKQFHLVDNPDLIFQIAQYKFKPPKNQGLSPVNLKNVYPKSQNKLSRHKSQQQQNILNERKVNTINKTKDKLFHYKISNRKSYQHQTNLKETNPINHSLKSKKITDKKLEENQFTNQKQKENIQARILFCQKPITQNDQNFKSLDNSNNKSWKKLFQRKKYSQLKQKLQNFIHEIQNCEDLNFSQVFEYEQIILRDFLHFFVIQLKKECVEKGSIIQVIWNAFSTLINKTLKTIYYKNKLNEKTQLQTQINIHSGYQQLHLSETHKIQQLNQKCIDAENVIDRLIYELRCKRKQIKKIYKNLAMCNEKLNQYKNQHIDLQKQHINLLVETQKINEEQAVCLLERKLQINRERAAQLKFGKKKDKLRPIIQAEIKQEKLKPDQVREHKKQLLDKIKITKMKKKFTFTEQKQNTNIVSEFIQKFSSKCIDSNAFQNQELAADLKLSKNTFISATATTTKLQKIPKVQFISSVTQSTFSDKMEFTLINNHSTQTPFTQKIKKFDSLGIQADAQNFRLQSLKFKMYTSRTFEMSFLFILQKNEDDEKNWTNNKKFKDQRYLVQQEPVSDEESIEVISKKGLSKRKSRAEKSSIFCYSNFANLHDFHNKNAISKNSSSRMSYKKRISEMPNKTQLQHFSGKGLKKTSYRKQHSFRSPENSRKSKNMSSINMPNTDSFNQTISINLQKQKYIEDFIMNKDQEYEVVDNSLILKIFIEHLMQKSKDANESGEIQNNFNKKKQSSSRASQVQTNQNFANIKSSSSFLKMETQPNEQHQLRKKNSKKSFCGFASINKIKNFSNFKQQKENLEKTNDLQKIIELSIKKSLIKKKVDSSNFQACKQKSEFGVISEKINPFMFDVEYLINQNCNKKRKPNLISLKSANKYIMMTYSRSIDKISRKNIILQNLIGPLFECFQITYGALKVNEVYKKMVVFISDLNLAKQSDNFKQFLFFLGLEKDNINSAYLTSFDVCLYLKLIQKLNIGGKIGNQIQSVFTCKTQVHSELISILYTENIAFEVVDAIRDKIGLLLVKLDNLVRQGDPKSDQQPKINLFKVSRIIVEEIIKIRIQAITKLKTFTASTTPEVKLKDLETVKRQTFFVDPIMKVIECCRISTSKKLYFSKFIEQLSTQDCSMPQSEKKVIKKCVLGVLLLRIGVLDFKDLEQRIKLIEQNQKKPENAEENTLNEDCQRLNQSTISQNIQRLFLVQKLTNQMFGWILGDLKIVYDIGLIKNLENKNIFTKILT